MTHDPKIRTYVGVHDDQYGGMTYLGGVVKDAWIFGLLPETQTCVGWTHAAMETLSEKIRIEWEKYGYLVSNLPDDVRRRHARIHAAAMVTARAHGWDPGSEEDEE